MRLAVIGGSFNPVHVGHMALARAVRERAGYDRVLFIPAASPPHKELSPGANDANRLDMLRLAVAELNADGGVGPWSDVDDCELVRGGVSYTIDTIRALKARYSARIEGKIALVIGLDLVPGFSRWREPDALSREADILLALRPGEEDASFPYPHRVLEGPLVEASSSAVRAAIRETEVNGAEGRDGAPGWASLVPASVYRYITERGLYAAR